jgi:two-component system, chemotaxis family, protein-glutamate methylesterase/glutaminase
LPAALFIVCHFPPSRRSMLPEILSRAGPLLATHPAHGAPIYPGQIYVAPPDHHMLLQVGTIELTQGPREDRHRPAIDPLFRSAARTYGPRVIALILSGTQTDGVAGLMAVRAAGGIGVVQDPADAAIPTLPLNATQIAGADHVVSLAGLPSVLVELIHQPTIEPPPAAPVDAAASSREAIRQTFAEQIRGERQGHISTMTCPECGGNLWQFKDDVLQEFRCHTGHVFHAEELLQGQSQSLESALWTAVRIFREKMVLARQLANQEFQRGHFEISERFEEEARICEDRSNVIQNTLLKPADSGRESREVSGKGGGTSKNQSLAN